MFLILPFLLCCHILHIMSLPFPLLSFISLLSSLLSLGSGKSYTMMGTGSDEPATKGLIPRICDGLFAKMKEVGGLSILYTPFSLSPSLLFISLSLSLSLPLSLPLVV